MTDIGGPDMSEVSVEPALHLEGVVESPTNPLVEMIGYNDPLQFDPQEINTGPYRLITEKIVPGFEQGPDWNTLKPAQQNMILALARKLLEGPSATDTSKGATIGAEFSTANTIASSQFMRGLTRGVGNSPYSMDSLRAKTREIESGIANRYATNFPPGVAFLLGLAVSDFPTRGPVVAAEALASAHRILVDSRSREKKTGEGSAAIIAVAESMKAIADGIYKGDFTSEQISDAMGLGQQAMHHMIKPRDEESIQVKLQPVLETPS